jgi:hypothetical protein
LLLWWLDGCRVWLSTPFTFLFIFFIKSSLGTSKFTYIKHVESIPQCAILQNS